MSVELRPQGVACNLSCHYCYQNPQRDAGNHRTPYNLELMKQETRRVGGPFTLFGGEPLLMRFEDLEDLFSFGMKEFGRSAIQTNGALIEDRHIELFRRYRVHVGVSIDGPGELNDARWNGSLEKTRAATARVELAIQRLCAAGVTPGLIVTLHRLNATQEKLPRMREWFHTLDAMGIRGVRLHLLEIDDPSVRNELTLSAKENVEALLAFAEAQTKLRNVRFDMFAEMEQLLLGNDSKVSCVWRACDPYTTEAVKGIEGNGQSSNCGRTNKDGIDFIKAAAPGFERYVALYNTPQSDKGCSGCRFFLMCKGQCPGTSAGGDWRNRSENCAEWKQLFYLLETRLVKAGKIPLTLQPVRLEVERRQVESWRQGRNPAISRTLRGIPGSISKREGTEADATENAQDRRKALSRVSWVGPKARDYWQPLLERLPEFLEDMAVITGSESARHCAIRLVPETSLDRLRALSKRFGVELGTLPANALPTAIPTRPDARGTALIVAGDERTIRRALTAWETGAIEELQLLLDVPSCCAAHAMGRGADATIEDSIHRLTLHSNTATISESVPFHPLLCHLGLSVLPIFPCRLDCAGALEAADRFLRIGRAAGFSEQVRDLYEVLSWPLSWTELHGVTEVKTPVFRFCDLSERDLGPKRILRAGTGQVKFAGVGLNFPFETSRRAKPRASVDAFAAQEILVQLEGSPGKHATECSGGAQKETG
jgi:radical SAM protein with 4Fe4S-binding SPASM domain